MPEYVKLDENDVVTHVIVADSDHVAQRADGPWLLPTGKVGIGYRLNSGIYLSALPATAEVDAPSPLQLSVSVASAETSPVYTYQWKKNGSNISGATSSLLVIDPSTASTDDGDYSCVVSDGTNTVETDACAVTVS